MRAISPPDTAPVLSILWRNSSRRHLPTTLPMSLSRVVLSSGLPKTDPRAGCLIGDAQTEKTTAMCARFWDWYGRGIECLSEPIQKTDNDLQIQTCA